MVHRGRKANGGTGHPPFLVLSVERNFQGNAIDIAMTLTLKGEVITPPRTSGAVSSA